MTAAGFVTNRLKSITVIALAGVALLYLTGLRQVAVGFILGVPVALLNLIIGSYVLARANKLGQRGIIFVPLGSLLRLIVAMAALAVAAQYGLQTVVGALASVLVELITYHIAMVRLLTGNQRGG